MLLEHAKPTRLTRAAGRLRSSFQASGVPRAEQDRAKASLGFDTSMLVSNANITIVRYYKML